MRASAESLATTLAYHERTKHYPGRYARALGHMDWATQPDPFRRFAAAPILPLDLVPVGDQPRYEPAFFLGNIPPAPLDRRWVSQLLQDSLALSAWKQAGGARWSLRSTRRAGISIRPKAISLRAPSRGCTLRLPSITTRLTSMRLNGGRTCRTKPGVPWRVRCLPRAYSSASLQSTGESLGNTASGPSATATMTSDTP